MKAQRQELTEQNESLRSKLGQIRSELDQLSKTLLDAQGDPVCVTGAGRLFRADGSAGKEARAGTVMKTPRRGCVRPTWEYFKLELMTFIGD